MKRIIIGAMLIAIVASGAVAALGMRLPDTADATEARVIPIRVSKYLTNSESLKDGDGCGFSLDFSRFFLTDQQVWVANERGEIIALRSLGEDSTWERRETGSLRCADEFDLPVPDAKFYTVYLNDERLVAFQPSDFPIDPMSEVWISLD